MPHLYEQYKTLHLDCSCLGLGRGPAQSEYFCTPVEAEVIAWTGVDGVHYCFVPGFDETVFVVGPMNGIGDYVYPVAETFTDFLRLVLACGGEAAITEAYDWTQTVFDAFLEENQPTAEQTAVLAQLRDAFDLTPMEEPFAYIKGVQAAFDYSQIPYSEKYRELTGDCEAITDAETVSAAASCWKVSYDGGFWSNEGNAGDEIVINKTFDWGEERWHIPSVYCFPEGLVIDFCMEVKPEPVRAFFAKWEPILARQPNPDRALRQQIEAEHPLDFRMRASVTVNGAALQADRGSGMFRIPAGCSSMDPENRQEAEAILDYYGLDPAKAWAFSRQSFRWQGACPEEIDTLQIKLERNPIAVPGDSFRVSGAGDSAVLRHPLTGAEHTLTVREYEAKEMDASHFQNPDMEYPTHYVGMVYTIWPELGKDECSVQDCSEGDAVRQKRRAETQGMIGGAVGVIGMIRDGDTEAMQHPDGAKAVPRAVCSALHFEPVQEVTWQPVFHRKTHEDLTVSLI